MTAVEKLEKELKERYSLMNSEPLFEQAKEIEKEQQNKLICEILQIQHLPPHIDESGADGTQGWDGIPDKETEQEDIALKAKEMEEQQKGYSKEEVIQLLIKMNSWPTIFDGEADISEWFEQVKSE